MLKIAYEAILKNHFDNAKDTLSNWEIDIAKTESQLALLTEGDKHESVYQAFRDVVFFACSCMDDTKAAANTFGKEWEAMKKREKSP